MTDHPRFRMTVGDVDLRHRHYHGAAQVELFFTLVDAWRAGKSRRATSAARAPQADVGAEGTSTHFSEAVARQGG